MRRLHKLPIRLLAHRPAYSHKALLASIAVIVVAGSYLVAHTFAATNQLYLTPASGTVINGNNVDIQIREDSGTDTVNAVQANLSYDPAKLQYVGVSSAGSAFPLEAQATGGAGTVQIAHAINGGSQPVSGDQLVATVTFKALVDSTTASIDFAAGSAVVRSTDNSNVLVNSAGATFTLGSPATPTPSATATLTPTPTPTATPTPSPTPTPGGTPYATVSLSPASGAYTVGNNVTVDVHENSYSYPVNAVQTNFDYDPAKFQFVSITAATSAFGIQAQSSGAGGHIMIGRGVNGGTQPLTGDQIVATVTLKALAAGTAAVTPASGSAVLSSADNTNLLNSITGGSYSLNAAVVSGGGNNPAPTPTQTPPVTVPVVGSHSSIPVKHTITVSAPALPDTTNVDYSVDGQNVDSPTIDTTQLSDGNHTITATSVAQGQKKTVSQTVTVQNNKPSFATFLASAKPALPYALGVVVLLTLGIAGVAIFHHVQGPVLGGTHGGPTGMVNTNLGSTYSPDNSPK